MASDVGQRLARHLHDVRSDRGELGRDPRIDVHDRDHSGALLELRAELTQRLIELTIGEDARPQPEDVVAQIADGTVDVLDRRFDPHGDPFILRECGNALQAHPDREERLDHTVVQLLRDPLSLVQDLEPPDLVLGAHHLLVQPRVLDGDTRLGRKDLKRTLIVRGELIGALFLRHIDVAEDLATGEHGSSHERPHRGVMRREADR